MSVSPCRLTPAALWLPIAAGVAAWTLVPYGSEALSYTYTYRWGAVALAILALLGRQSRWAERGALLLGAAGGGYVAYVHGSRLIAGTSLPLGEALEAITGVWVVAMGIGPLRRRLGLADPLQLVAAQLLFGVLGRLLLIGGLYRIHGIPLVPAFGWVSVVQTDAPYLALAVGAIGLGMTRGVRESALRLGLARPRWWQIVIALAVADAMLLADAPVNRFLYTVDPRGMAPIARYLQQSHGGLDPATAIFVALAAAVSEELLYRGAVQPYAGIVVTAIIFGANHSQYASSILLLGWITLNGVAFGYLRHAFNTTTAITAHFAYDAFIAFYHTVAPVLIPLLVAEWLVIAVWVVVTRHGITIRRHSDGSRVPQPNAEHVAPVALQGRK